MTKEWAHTGRITGKRRRFVCEPPLSAYRVRAAEQKRLCAPERRRLGRRQPRRSRETLGERAVQAHRERRLRLRCRSGACAPEQSHAQRRRPEQRHIGRRQKAQIGLDRARGVKRGVGTSEARSKQRRVRQGLAAAK